MSFMGFLNGLFEHFPLYYCLQSISLNLVIESLLQIGTISLLQHLQVALQLIEFGIKFNCVGGSWENRSGGLSRGGWLDGGLSFGIPYDQFKRFTHKFNNINSMLPIIIHTIQFIQLIICQYSIALQLIIQMLPFKPYAQEIMSLFIDKLYRDCRYQMMLKEQEIELVEKLMLKKLRHPQLLFKSLVKRPPNIVDKKLQTQEEVPQLLGIDLMDIAQAEQEVKHAQLNPNSSISLCLNNLDLIQQNQTKNTPYKIQTDLPICHKQSQLDLNSDSEDSYDEEIRMIEETRMLAHKHCKYHLSGLYNNTVRQMNYNKTLRRMQMPLVLVKQSDSPQQYIIQNCQADFFMGTVEGAHFVLMGKQEGQQQK